MADLSASLRSEPRSMSMPEIPINPAAGLPEIRVIALSPGREEPPPHRERRGRPALPARTSDQRWCLVQAFLASQTLAPNSCKVYERELKRFLNWTELPWQALYPRHLQQYKRYLLQEATTHQGKPLSRSSVNSAIAALRSFFAWLQQTEPTLLQVNPVIDVRLDSLDPPPIHPLTPEQLEQVWAVLDQLEETRERDTALLHVLSHGLRAGEVVALNVAAFDGQHLQLGHPNDKADRVVPLHPASCQALQGYLTWRQQQGEAVTGDRPLILSHHTTRKGQRLSYHGVYFAIEKIGQLAGLPDLHPHRFRHTYTTELLQQGVDSGEACHRTGHGSKTALRRYRTQS